MTSTLERARTLARRALMEDELSTIEPADLHGPDPEVPAVIWRDVAVLLDASDPELPYVEDVFEVVAERPPARPDEDRVAVRVDLLGCAGLKPKVARFGYGIRMWDAERQMTVGDAIDACAEASPPPEHLVLVSDRAPTGDWQPALARWRLAVQRHGRVPKTTHVVWGGHLGELDGFAPAADGTQMHHVGSRAEIRSLLNALWPTSLAFDRVRVRGSRPMPRTRRTASVLKPWTE